MLKAPVQPIVLRRLDLRCGEWTVRSLRVNRHLQPFDRYAPHRHAHGQLLLYLRGRGEQRVGDKKLPVGPGAVFFIPPARVHEFREQAPRRAICLVADLGGKGPRALGFRHGWLSAEALACLKEPQGSGGAAIMKRLQRVWRPDATSGSSWVRPAELAKRVGLQKDYLNRLVRRATGLTLGQWRDRELLRAAEASLRHGHRVAVVASDLGFSDANYFARWFRKQTGLSPSHWSNR